VRHGPAVAPPFRCLRPRRRPGARPHTSRCAWSEFGSLWRSCSKGKQPKSITNSITPMAQTWRVGWGAGRQGRWDAAEGLLREDEGGGRRQPAGGGGACSSMAKRSAAQPPTRPHSSIARQGAAPPPLPPLRRRGAPRRADPAAPPFRCHARSRRRRRRRSPGVHTWRAGSGETCRPASPAPCACPPSRPRPTRARTWRGWSVCVEGGQEGARRSGARGRRWPGRRPPQQGAAAPARSRRRPLRAFRVLGCSGF
jgi:hypothetical protein